MCDVKLYSLTSDAAQWFVGWLVGMVVGHTVSDEVRVPQIGGFVPPFKFLLLSELLKISK